MTVVTMRTLEQIQQIINSQTQPQADFGCKHHQHRCTLFMFQCCFNTAKNSYKTYALVYLFQLITNSKKFRRNPKKQIPKFLLNYIKSVSFTAVDMMVMRRFLCFYNKYISAHSKSLILANFLGGLYLAVESKNRQIQIALYALNKAVQTVYNGYVRRNPNFDVPLGSALLFAISISIISYHYFNNRQVFRPAYEKGFGFMLKDI